MPVLRFENPSLKLIYHSLKRMNQRMDLFIFKLFFFFDRNRRLIMQDPTINISLNPSDEDESIYANPISLKSFSELKNPVLDSEGYLREKDEEQINLGIYTRKPVTILESTDLKKIQGDYRSLEKKMDAMMEKMEKMAEGFEKKWEERERQWEEKEKRWAQEKEVTGTVLRMLEFEVTHLKNENEKLKNQLKNNSWDLSDTEYSDEEEIMVSKSAPQLGFKNEHNLPLEAKWQERNTLRGIQYTFWEDKYPEEKKGDRLRLHAYHGRTKQFEKQLDRNKTLANSRGFPDALHSTWLGLDDKTSLMVASRNGNIDIVKKLVEEGAHVNFLDCKRQTALDYAERHHHQDIADFLKGKGAKNGQEIKEIFEDIPSNSQSLPVLIRPCR